MPKLGKKSVFRLEMYEKLKSSRLLQVFMIYTRYLIGGAYVFASIVKVKGERFYTDLESIESSKFGEIAHFFETMYQSGIYWQFIGWGQLIAAFILMTQRFSKLGAIIFLPVSLNIFVITFSLGFGNTTVITFFMLLANLMLLAWDWDELKSIINIHSQKIIIKASFEKLQVWEIAGVLIFFSTLIVRLYFQNFWVFLAWASSCTVIALLALFIAQKKTKGNESLNF